MTQAANLAALGSNVNSSGIAQAAGGGTAGTNGAIGFKNRFINGNMAISQRYGSSSVTPASGVTYTLDRWHINAAQSSKLSVQQNAGSVTPPVGFTYYVGMTSLSSYSVGSGDYHTLRQSIEGYNIADLGWGTANAKTITFSFWVRSSLTGTFGGTLNNADYSRSYPFSYTISAANTWEYKTITIAGDTSGTWLTDNSIGISVGFQLGTGSTYTGPAGSWSSTLYLGTTGTTNIIATNGATLYITGCQFEVGTAATNFDVRDYGRELMLCQRYYCQSNNQTNAAGLYNSSSFDYISSWDYSSGAWVGQARPFPVSMRTIPSCSIYTSGVASNSSAGYVSFYQGSWGTVTAVTHSGTNERSLCFNGGGGSAGSALIQLNYTASAEL